MEQAKFAVLSRDRTYWRRLLRFSLISLVTALLITIYGVLPVIYANGVAHPQRAKVCCKTPQDYGFEYQTVAFPTSDGLTLRGWYIPTRNGSAIIVTHPVGSNRSAMMDQAVMLARHGYGVLLFDLRAHGESDGTTITFSGEDVLAGVKFVETSYGIGPGRVGALGASLGGLVSIQAAAAPGSLRAIVVDGAGIADFADEPAPTSVGHFLDLPFQWVATQVWRLNGAAPPLPAVKALPRIAPRAVMFISGTQNLLERGLMRKFYTASLEPRTLWEVPEAGHVGAWAARPGEYEMRVIEFFDAAFASSK